MKKSIAADPLLLLRERLRLGQTTTLVVDADDDTEIEIVATLRRRTPTATEAAALRAEAIAWLLKEHDGKRVNLHSVAHCGCYKQRRSRFGGGGGPCDGRVVAAVAYRSSFAMGVASSALSSAFLFICGRHRDSHPIELNRVVGIVELPEPSLAEARRLNAEEAAAWNARNREAEKDAEQRRAAEDAIPVKRIPLCAASMGCLCWFHARGGNVDAQCDASEGVRK